jgi:hypothetical protein
MNGKIVGLGLLGAAALAGAGLFYLEQFHWYDVSEDPRGTLRILAEDGGTIELPVTLLRVAEGSSSPLKYRACFATATTSAALGDRAVIHPDPVPTVAPLSFPCFDADAIAGALDAGSATAYLSRENEPYGIDRVVALTETGAGYAWHQINRCGERVFDGDPPPEGCPPPPSSLAQTE